jgi:hypothetical protein
MINRPSELFQKEASIKEIENFETPNYKSGLVSLLADEHDNSDDQVMIRRNFNLTKANIRRIKLCVDRLQAKGVKTNQDSVINEIMDIFFADAGIK